MKNAVCASSETQRPCFLICRLGGERAFWHRADAFRHGEWRSGCRPPRLGTSRGCARCRSDTARRGRPADSGRLRTVPVRIDPDTVPGFGHRPEPAPNDRPALTGRQPLACGVPPDRRAGSGPAVRQPRSPPWPSAGAGTRSPTPSGMRRSEPWAPRRLARPGVAGRADGTGGALRNGRRPGHRARAGVSSEKVSGHFI